MKHYPLRLATQSSSRLFIRIATATQRKHHKHQRIRTWRGPIIEHTKKQAAFSTCLRNTKLHLGDCASAGAIRATFPTRLLFSNLFEPPSRNPADPGIARTSTRASRRTTSHVNGLVWSPEVGHHQRAASAHPVSWYDSYSRLVS